MWPRFNGNANQRPPNTAQQQNPLTRSLASIPAYTGVAGQIVGARGSRYSAAEEDFFQDVNTFSSPVQNRFGNTRLNNSASQRYSVLGNLQRRNRVEPGSLSLENSADGSAAVAENPSDTDENLNENIVDHSTLLAADFNKFLYDEQLSDVTIKVRKLKTIFGEEINQINTNLPLVSIPAHKIVLASRCSYFYAKFCREWADKNLEATFTEFTETPMREFLRYLYTGKLAIDLNTVMGVMKISSYFNMDDLVKACKNYLTSDVLNAFDLCVLYCEVRDQSHDFDDMRSFLTRLIPRKMDNQILCRVLREIWIAPVKIRLVNSNNSKSQVIEPNSKTIVQSPLDSAKKPLSEGTLDPNDIELAEVSLFVVKEENASTVDIVLLKDSAEAEVERSSGKSKQSNKIELEEELKVADQAKLAASNDFEREEKRDLQEILLSKIQLNLPEILKSNSTKNDLFQLPREALQLIFSDSSTCLSEYQLFKAITDRIANSIDCLNQEDEELKEIKEEDNSRQSDQSLCLNEEQTFLKQMLKFVRLPLINMRQLVTDIKFSGYFNDQAIFEALQFQLAQHVLNQDKLKEGNFRHRGIQTVFNHKHFDLGVQQLPDGVIQLQRDKVCQSTDESTISAITEEPLPLHGIHYWEIKLTTDNPSHLKKVYIGLCSVSDNQSLEDTWRSKSAVLLNCFDSSFWNNGQQVQVFSNKYIKIKQPMEDNDIIRIAVDLRMANQFESFWNQQASGLQPGQQLNVAEGVGNGLLGRPSVQNLQDRFRDSARPVDIQRRGGRSARDNINILLNTNYDMMFFNSPCKLHFACNGSEFHEGVDLNLMTLSESPLHLCISLPANRGVVVQMSKAVYFPDWDLIPKEPFLFQQKKQ